MNEERKRNHRNERDFKTQLETEKQRNQEIHKNFQELLANVKSNYNENSAVTVKVMTEKMQNLFERINSLTNEVEVSHIVLA